MCTHTQVACGSVFLVSIVPTGFAVEDHDHLTGHVERSQQGGDETDDPQHDVLVVGGEQDVVLAPEPSERRHSGNGEPADDERRGSDRHQLAQCTHTAHVLFVVHAVDDRTGTEEQQRLEERVSHHVEDGGGVRTGTNRQEHVAELADRGVGQHLLDVVLGDGDTGCVERRGSTDDGDDRGRIAAGDVQDRADAAHQIHTSGDHRGRVDQGRHRGGAFHRVGQPQVQRQLRTLPAGADEGEQRDGCGGGDAEAGCGTVDRRVVQRADCPEGEEHRHHEAPVAHAVGDECLLAGSRGAVLFVPEADQEVRAGAHTLPAEERDQHVRAEHQHEHAECEQVEVQEELAEPRIAVHVADGVEVDQRPDTCDEQTHRDAERISEECQVDMGAPERNPLEQGLDVVPFFGGLRQQIEEHAERDDE